MLYRAIWRTACLFLLLAASARAADPYKPGDTLAGLQGTDQHGAAIGVKKGETRFVVFDTPGESGPAEQPKDADWFSKHHALLVVNLSEFSGLKHRIAKSRLQSKPFRVLVLDDKHVAERFPTQKNKLTVLVLDDQGSIKEIRTPAPGSELQELLAGSQK